MDEDLKVWEYFNDVREEPHVENQEADADDMEAGDNYWEPEPHDMSFEAHDMSFEADDSTADGPYVETGGTQLWVYRDENQEAQWKMGGRSQFRESSTWNNEVIEFLCDLQDVIQEAVEVPELEIYTYHKRGDDIFRGHPNYRGAGHWRDWVWVQWDEEYCCHIWCFVVLPDLEGRDVHFGGMPLEEGVFAVVESTEKVLLTDKERESELLVPIEKERVVNSVDGVTSKKLYLADTKAFVAPACVVPDIGGPSNRYFVVESRTQWPGFCIDWFEKSENDDPISPIASDAEAGADFETTTDEEEEEDAD